MSAQGRSNELLAAVTGIVFGLSVSICAFDVADACFDASHQEPKPKPPTTEQRVEALEKRIAELEAVK